MYQTEAEARAAAGERENVYRVTHSSSPDLFAVARSPAILKARLFGTGATGFALCRKPSGPRRVPTTAERVSRWDDARLAEFADAIKAERAARRQKSS